MVKAFYAKVIKFGKNKLQVQADRLTDRKLMASANKGDFKKLLKEFKSKPHSLPLPIPNPDIEVNDNSEIAA